MDKFRRDYNSRHGDWTRRERDGYGNSNNNNARANNNVSGGGGWRTYKQAKMAESTYRRRHHNRPRGTSSGYYDRQPRWTAPRPYSRDRDDYYFDVLRRTTPPPSIPSSARVSKKEKEVGDLEVDKEIEVLKVDKEIEVLTVDKEVEVLEVGKEKQKSINHKQEDGVTRSPVNEKPGSSRRGLKTGAETFDPFKPIKLAPAASSTVNSKMYEDMLGDNVKRGFQFTSYKFKDEKECQLFAETNSPGSFVTNMDSKYGNCLMPVMPRIDPPE